MSGAHSCNAKKSNTAELTTVPGGQAMKITRFEDLDAWKEGRKLVNKIYGLSSGQKFSKDFSLKDQIRRAVISITSNIAEGFDAQSNAEFVRFLAYGRRSSSEVKNQLYIALDQKYITQEQFEEAYELASTVSKIIFGLIRYLRRARAQRVSS
jgi:four helix bundle protein